MDTQQTFIITGLTCAACTKLSGKRIKGLPGVKDVTVNLAGGKAEILADHPISLHEVKTALSGSGYDAEEYHD